MKKNRNQNTKKGSENIDIQTGIQNQGKNPKSGMHGNGKINQMGQGSVAGSTGTGNQGKVGNPVSGK